MCLDVFCFSLTLNLKKINSIQSPNSCEPNIGSSADNCTVSSDTYHTAASGCSTQLLSPNGIECLMSDSGVELRPSPRPHDESDLSSTEDCKVNIFLYVLKSSVLFFKYQNIYLKSEKGVSNQKLKVSAKSFCCLFYFYFFSSDIYFFLGCNK